MKRTLLLIFTVSIGYITLSGYAAGPSGTPIGALTAKSGCGGGSCHGAQTTPTSFTLQLIQDGETDTVSDGKYKPGARYNISFTSQIASASKFGFIMLVTDATNNQAGILDNPFSSPQFKITTKGQYIVAEQPSALSPVSGGVGATVDWKSPAKGTGAVTIYVAVNGCNGNGSADAGDNWSTRSLTLQEGDALSVDDMTNAISVTAYPNPAVNTLNVDIRNTTSSDYQYAIYGINGAVTATGQMNNNINSIDISALQSGVHFLKLTDGNQVKTLTFNKL